jgi:hypothetical protein
MGIMAAITSTTNVFTAETHTTEKENFPWRPIIAIGKTVVALSQPSQNVDGSNHGGGVF